MVRRQSHADPPLSSGVDDGVPVVVLEDAAAKNACPERTLGIEVGRIEHDHLTHHVHDTQTTGASAGLSAWEVSVTVRG